MAALLFSLMFLALSGCADGELFNPNRNATTQLSLRPYFAVSGGALALVDINQVRVTVHRRPGGEVVSQQVISVDPAATSYNLTLDAPANSDLRILIELLNVVGVVTTVQFSGEIELSVTTGPQNTAPTDIPVFPGGPENLRITALSIAPRNHSMLEGETVRLQANVTGGPSNPVITWISLNSAVATVGPDGTVTAVRPGNAVITAQAGPQLDNVTVEVGARATAVLVSPSAPVVTSFGNDVTFSARVVDVRNNDVPGFGVTWSITDPNLATQVAPGVFRARRNGTTVVTATATQFDRTITGIATLKVEQRPVTLVLDPVSATFNAFGATQTFRAQGRDAGGNPVDGLVFTWTSSNPAIAPVDANGVVTARANGVTTITASGGGASAEAAVNVQQLATTLIITPQQSTLRSINETVQLRAEVKDARGNMMNVPVTWTSSISGIAEVDASGLVTAKGDGPVVIGATAGGQRANATILVQRVGTRITLSEPPRELNAGTSFQLHGTVVDANGFALESQTMTWASNKPSVAGVNSTGLVTGISAGEAEITAKSGNAFGVARFVIKGSTGFHIANGRVLLYNADGGTATDFRNRLVATGVFTADKIDLMDMYSTLPTVSTLSAYGCVLAWTNSAPPNGAQIGDRLKEYVDAGGKVVLAVYALGVPSRPWELAGGIMGAGYSPLTLTENQSNDFQHKLDFTTAVTSHPILEGVTSFTYFTNTNYTKPTLSTGATLVAKDNHGDPLIAVNANGRVVAVNVWPGYSFHGTTSSKPFIDRAFANACR